MEKSPEDQRIERLGKGGGAVWDLIVWFWDES